MPHVAVSHTRRIFFTSSLSGLGSEKSNSGCAMFSDSVFGVVVRLPRIPEDVDGMRSSDSCSEPDDWLLPPSVVDPDLGDVPAAAVRLERGIVLSRGRNQGANYTARVKTMSKVTNFVGKRAKKSSKVISLSGVEAGERFLALRCLALVRWRQISLFALRRGLRCCACRQSTITTLQATVRQGFHNDN